MCTYTTGYTRKFQGSSTHTEEGQKYLRPGTRRKCAGRGARCQTPRGRKKERSHRMFWKARTSTKKVGTAKSEGPGPDLALQEYVNNNNDDDQLKKQAPPSSPAQQDSLDANSVARPDGSHRIRKAAAGQACCCCVERAGILVYTRVQRLAGRSGGLSAASAALGAVHVRRNLCSMGVGT